MPSLLETHATAIDAAIMQHLAKRSLTIPQTVRSEEELAFPFVPNRWLVTRSYSYFMTKPDWKPEQGLTRASFDPVPFRSGEADGPPEASSRALRPVLPARSKGRHVIVDIWGGHGGPVADAGRLTGEFFVSVCDVQFI